jgi:hypothetical protein
MTTYTPHTLVTFGGVLNNAVPDKEIWQCGIRLLDAAGTAPLADHQEFCDAVFTPLATWFALSTSSIGLPNTCELKWVKANPIASSGLYADDTTYLHDYTSPVVGGLAGASVDILALAISWGTAKTIRKHSYATHGRIYLPVYTILPNVAGMRITSAQAAAWAARGKALLSLLAGTTQPAMPVVASNHDGEIEPITHVRVGDVIDVQRRRKSALKEVYSSLAYP